MLPVRCLEALVCDSCVLHGRFMRCRPLISQPGAPELLSSRVFSYEDGGRVLVQMDLHTLKTLRDGSCVFLQGSQSVTQVLPLECFMVLIAKKLWGENDSHIGSFVDR